MCTICIARYVRIFYRLYSHIRDNHHERLTYSESSNTSTISSSTPVRHQRELTIWRGPSLLSSYLLKIMMLPVPTIVRHRGLTLSASANVRTTWLIRWNRRRWRTNSVCCCRRRRRLRLVLVFSIFPQCMLIFLQRYLKLCWHRYLSSLLSSIPWSPLTTISTN